MSPENRLISFFVGFHIPFFHVPMLLLWWLSIVSAAITFTCSTIGLGLEVAKVVETGKFRGCLIGIIIGTVTETRRWGGDFRLLETLPLLTPTPSSSLKFRMQCFFVAPFREITEET
ncbi:hypothetical protein SAY86_009983 [Trapa natans]|uniref:Uncharacterized protein n=1 Tax=Trapa natans TaxID=22666 RepID=A0AAN7KRU9_TRANT|nr:hypothetical protein SAY86_009983 [Trapa natans]